MITNQLNTPIKCLQSDNWGGGGGGGGGGVWSSLLFNLTLKIMVLYIDSLVLIPPQQNGCAERKIRHVVETRLALLLKPPYLLSSRCKHSTLPPILFISFLSKYYLITLQFSFFLTSQIMFIFAFLDVFASLPYGLICQTNFPIDLFLVFFWVMHIFK